VLNHGTISYTVGNWQPPYGIELVVDPLSAMMMVLVSVVALLASFSALKSVEQELPGREAFFFTLYLILIAGLHGLIVTADAFNLYVLLEITSITTYGLVAMGRGRAVLSSFKYIIMGTIGACFYLLGVGYIYILTGTLNMADIARILPTLNAPVATTTAIAFVLVGLWIKMAFFPLHSWLPNA
jgi:multicomponent Na+:H+ antiporter subunit D